MKLLVFLLIFCSAFAKHGTKKTDADNPEVAGMISKAKTLLAQAKRKEAIEMLDHALTLTTSKTQRADLTAKRNLFIEQFLTSDSFQHYEEAKEFSDVQRPEDCLRELEGVSPGDRDNSIVLRLKASCQFDSKLYDQAQKTFQSLLIVLPGDLPSTFGSIEIDLRQKQYARALKTVDSLEVSASADIERQTLLRARLHDLMGDQSLAEEVLRRDHEAYLDHIGVLYELGMLYTRMPARDWPARKMLSLFVTRCKRMSEAELKTRHFDTLLVQAQATLSALDRKLGV